MAAENVRNTKGKKTVLSDNKTVGTGEQESYPSYTLKTSTMRNLIVVAL